MPCRAMIQLAINNKRNMIVFLEEGVTKNYDIAVKLFTFYKNGEKKSCLSAGSIQIIPYCSSY